MAGNLDLGTFSISLAVADLDASRDYYEHLGFEVVGGSADEQYLILVNGSAVIGLFHGMFERNILTFTPGVIGPTDDAPSGGVAAYFTDVREIQARLRAAGIELVEDTDPNGTGPAHITLFDPDGNPILIDQKTDRPAMPGVFISYRREETAWAAVPLYHRLRDQFGAERVFKDIDSIDLGEDFLEKITEAVGSAAALLVLIGRQWPTITDDGGQRRLDDPHDFVRLEVEAGLARDVRVIPVLVDGARMPAAAALPDSLKGLARLQALKLDHERFDSDMHRLLQALERTLGAEDGSS